MVLQLKNVTKKYGSKTALDGVSFDIGEGSITGLLGPNGSGKTTLIKIINNLITDYTGSVLVCGQPLGIGAREKISYLPDKEYLRREMRISTVIGMYSDFFRDFDRSKALEMLGTVKLEPGMRISTLSKGMNEKLQLVLTMSRAASLYVFDEPIAGVDPAARDFILDTIIRNYREEASILISTHLISDIEHLIDRVIFIKEGRIALDRDSDGLRGEQGKSVDQIFREVFR